MNVKQLYIKVHNRMEKNQLIENLRMQTRILEYKIESWELAEGKLL